MEQTLRNDHGESPLNKACENGHDSTIQYLLRHGADNDLCDFRERRPLDAACCNKKHSKVKLLLSHGTANNLCNTLGNSPLNTACLH